MEASTAGPTSGLSGDFSLGGSTGGVGLFQPTSSSSSLTSDQFPATSQPAPADRTESHVPSFSSLCQDKFNDNINSSVFDLHTDSADLAKTVEQLESIAFTPFIPARTHHHARSSNWLRDVLDSSENRVERYLILASKDLIMSRPEGEARKERTSDVMLLIAEALQEESHTRIQAEFGFDAARTLKEDQKDPLVSSDKLAKITPKLEAWKTRREAIIRAQRTRTYFFGVRRPKEALDQKEGQAGCGREWFLHQKHQEPGGGSCRGWDSANCGRVGFTGGAQCYTGRNLTNLEGEECKGAPKKRWWRLGEASLDPSRKRKNARSGCRKALLRGSWFSFLQVQRNDSTPCFL